MRRTKPVVERLRFCAENNMGYGDYHIDWDTGEKNINPWSGLSVNEGGRITLTNDGSRNIDMRNSWRAEFGIDVINTDLALLPRKMYAPGTSRAIPKNALLDSSFLVDHETGRVLALSNTRADGYAYWMHPEAPANTGAALKTRERNKAREVSWMEEHKQDLLIGDGICALSSQYENAKSYAAVGGYQNLAKWMKGTIMIAPTASHAYAHALAHLKTTPDWEEGFLNATADFREYNYLCLKPNTYTLWA